MQTTSQTDLLNCQPVYYYIQKPFVNMRNLPDNRSKVVSQALFAEKINLIKKSGDWSYIETPDHYKGWILSKTIIALNEAYETSLKVARQAAYVFPVKDTEYGPLLKLPYGSPLKVGDESDARWLKVALPNLQEAYIQKGDVTSGQPPLKKENLRDLSMEFLNIPYLWGGRSSFGYDCSGFVQMLYSHLNVSLPRDSGDQIKFEGFKEVSLEALEPGDLVFFGKTAEKVVHVGMCIGNDNFIHSTIRENKPWIHVSSLSDQIWKGTPESDFPFRSFRQLKK